MVSQGRQSCTSHTVAPSSNTVTCQSPSPRLSSHLHAPGPYRPRQSAIYMVLYLFSPPPLSGPACCFLALYVSMTRLAFFIRVVIIISSLVCDMMSRSQTRPSHHCKFLQSLKEIVKE